MLAILADAATAGASAAGWGGMILWLVILFAFMYFFMIRPQKKEQQKKTSMLSELAVGDTVLTTSGFYGTVIDIDEDTVIVFFGDHLPTMGLQDSDMRSGDIYKTKYVTWNNMGLEKKDADLYAYQLMASITNSVGIHEGTILNYHQTQMNSADYQDGLENLQYDILYGDRYCYNGKDKYPATDIVMGIDPVTVDNATNSIGNSEVIIRGTHFTKWSKVFVNETKVNTIFSGPECLIINKDDISDGDTIQVCQMGSNNAVFRESNTFVYSDPDVISTEDPTEATEADTTADTQTTENSESAQ